VVDAADHEVLDTARRKAGLSIERLWVRYFELGGLASVMELEAFLSGALVPTRFERDVLAHAINEALNERGLDQTLGYDFPGVSGPH